MASISDRSQGRAARDYGGTNERFALVSSVVTPDSNARERGRLRAHRKSIRRTRKEMYGSKKTEHGTLIVAVRRKQRDFCPGCMHAVP